MEEPRPNGRPSVMTAETIVKLEGAFLNGASDIEASFIAGIGVRTLYDYCQDNEEFSHRKEALKDMVKYKARQNIVAAINEGDKTLSQWYLERKVKGEFAQRNEQTGKDGKDIVPEQTSEVKDLIKKIDDLISTENRAG